MEILENFSLSKPYRFCIYLSSVILVSSFLSVPSDINIVNLRKSCLWLIIIGLIAWTAENIYYDYLSELEYDREIDARERFGKYRMFKVILNVAYLIIGYLILVNF